MMVRKSVPKWDKWIVEAGFKLGSKSKVVCDGTPSGPVRERGSGNGGRTNDLAASAGSISVIIKDWKIIVVDEVRGGEARIISA